MNNRMDLLAGQRKLVLIWLIGASPVTLLVLIRTFGPNAVDIDRVWSWLLPSVMPNLSLVVGTYAAAALAEPGKRGTVDALFFRVAAAISAVYLLIVTLAVALYPFSAPPAIRTLDRISLLLGPVQGLVSACLGVFFVSQKQHSSS